MPGGGEGSPDVVDEGGVSVVRMSSKWLGGKGWGRLRRGLGGKCGHGWSHDIRPTLRL